MKYLLTVALSIIVVVSCVPPHADARQLCQNQLIDNSPNGSGDGFCADFWVLPHRAIWTSVFGPGPLWQMNWTLPTIDWEVTTTGQYQCVDHLGRPFTLNVLSHDWFDYAGDLDAAGLTQSDVELIFARDASASVVIADLYAGFMPVPVVALCFAYTDVHGVRQSMLFVLYRVDESAAQIVRSTAQIVTLGGFSWQGCFVTCDPGASPECGDPVCCLSRFNCFQTLDRNKLSKCIHDRVPPLAWTAVVCVLGCVVSGPAYLACLGACLGADALAFLIETSGCEAQYIADDAASKAAYCNCMKWKQLNCPSNNNPENQPIMPCP